MYITGPSLAKEKYRLTILFSIHGGRRAPRRYLRPFELKDRVAGGVVNDIEASNVVLFSNLVQQRCQSRCKQGCSRGTATEVNREVSSSRCKQGWYYLIVLLVIRCFVLFVESFVDCSRTRHTLSKTTILRDEIVSRIAQCLCVRYHRQF